MTIRAEPFSRQHIEKKADTFTVRLNEKERKSLDKIKLLLDIPSDSTALKVAADAWLNVTHRMFGSHYIRWLFKKERGRLSDHTDIDKQLRGDM